MNSIDWLSSQDLPFEKLENANILITGANGMIASDFVESLLLLNDDRDLNMNIYAMCRSRENADKRFSGIKNNSFHLIIQDVIWPISEEIEYRYIFHLASSANPEAFNKYPVDVMRANFIGTMNLLEYTRKVKDCRLIFVSTSEVYGENFEEIDNFGEDYNGSIDYFRFRACYPESKRASETLCKCYEKQYETDVVIARPAFIYGKNIIDSNNRADVYFLRQAINKQDIIMYSAGEQIRSYCYVNDCISGFLYIALKGKTGEAYNIGNMECIISMKDYAQKIADMGGVDLVFDPDSAPKNKVLLQTKRLVLNTRKLESLGWRPQYSLDRGLNEIFEGASNAGQI